MGLAIFPLISKIFHIYRSKSGKSMHRFCKLASSSFSNLYNQLLDLLHFEIMISRKILAAFLLYQPQISEKYSSAGSWQHLSVWTYFVHSSILQIREIFQTVQIFTCRATSLLVIWHSICKTGSKYCQNSYPIGLPFFFYQKYYL